MIPNMATHGFLKKSVQDGWKDTPVSEAAILEKVPKEQFCGKTGHDLESLGKRYAKLYPGKKFAFEVPFGTEETKLVNPDPCDCENGVHLSKEYDHSIYR